MKIESIAEALVQQVVVDSPSLASPPRHFTTKSPVDFWSSPAVIAPNNFVYKSLSNWAFNIAVGCSHACRFCYVPSAATIKQAAKLAEYGVNDPDAEWGDYVLLRPWDEKKFLTSLRAAENTRRSQLKPDGNRAVIYCSTTDPYQPLERKYQVTRQCLEVFARYDDLDLLVVQTRSQLAERDLPLMLQIPYAWLSITIETNDQVYLKGLKGGPPLSTRWELVRTASARGVPTQITISPCLRYTGVEEFGQQLLHSGAHRLVVDSVTDGDGAQGERTARSPFAKAEPDWANTSHAHQLYHYLLGKAVGTGISLGWSNAGFCGIPLSLKTTENSRLQQD